MACHGQGRPDPAQKGRRSKPEVIQLRPCFRITNWRRKATERIGIVPGYTAAALRPGRSPARSRPPEPNPSCPDTAALD